jgi:hypothetical protein
MRRSGGVEIERIGVNMSGLAVHLQTTITSWRMVQQEFSNFRNHKEAEESGQRSK